MNPFADELVRQAARDTYARAKHVRQILLFVAAGLLLAAAIAVYCYSRGYY